MTDLDPALSSAASTRRAVSAAEAAARAAGAHVREISALDELDQVVELYEAIWRRDGNPPISTELLRAFSKAGNYVAAAFCGSEVVGSCVGFFGAPAQPALHSHIAGVSPAVRGRQVGFALKLHQRAWALLRETPVIAWTFDPLVSRNAHFNVTKLGAEPVEYLPNFYGAMRDLINGDDDSDRLLLEWRLTSAAVETACAGHGRPSTAAADVLLAISDVGRPERQPASGEQVVVAVPADIEALRSTDPGAAKDWRIAVRETLTELLGTGARITGFDRSRGYLVTRTEQS